MSAMTTDDNVIHLDIKKPKKPKKVTKEYKYYVLYKELYQDYPQTAYVKADGPYNAARVARISGWMDFYGNNFSGLDLESPYELYVILEGWPRDLTPDRTRC